MVELIIEKKTQPEVEVILVIEDDRDLRELLINMLSMEGYRVMGADNVMSGIEKLRSVKPDLIVCNVMMPDMDGYQVLLSLKEIYPSSQIPLVYISARAGRDDYRMAMDFGANEYLTKPFSAHELKSCVKSQLEKSKTIEKRVMEKIERIEGFIQERIAGLESVIKRQASEIGRISEVNIELEENLNKMEDEVSNGSLIVLDTTNTLQNMEKLINAEVSRQDITFKERSTLLKLKNHIHSRNLYVDSWTVFQMQFNKTHPGFLRRVVKLYPHLSQMELTLTCAIVLNYSTNQLAKMFGILPESVRKNKYRLKSRMGLESNTNLREHILSLEIDSN